MDLREFQHDALPRHPWEKSRVKVLKKILSPHRYKDHPRVLDLGCGDGFTTAELFRGTHAFHVDAVDINLTEKRAEEFSRKRGFPIYCNYDQLQKKSYDMILALDVIEHVRDDVSFLREIINEYSAGDAVILITAPAYNSLYSSHDSFLRHYRRYNIRELQSVLTQAGLNIMASGYLFSTLLLLRCVTVCFHRVTGRTGSNKGVGEWNHGHVATRGIEFILFIDNVLSLFLNRLGLKIPGLTVWALCRKQ